MNPNDSRRDTAAAAVPLAAMVVLLAAFALTIWVLIQEQVEDLQAAGPATITAEVVDTADAAVTD